MSYDDRDTPEHRSAIKQLAAARQRALDSIHAVRAGDHNRRSANLIEVPDQPVRGDHAHPMAEATGNVCNYLVHLKPFGLGSKRWQTGLGVIDILKKTEKDKPGLHRGSIQYKCTRMPYLNINDMNAAIRAGNLQVFYARDSGGATFTPKRQRQNDICRVEGHDLTPAGYQQLQSGTDIAECEHARGQSLNTDFEPASRGDDEVAFKFVYTADQLLTIYEVADEIAAAEDLLANIDTPDHNPGGKGAV
jgi:hypothetical protein